jgi:hypothetical protein
MVLRVGDTVWVTCRGSKRALARRVLVWLAAAGCAHTAPLPADHPADARAPIGRLASPSPTLAPGVVTYAEPAAATAPAEHAGHAMPADPAGHTAGGAKPADAAKPTDAKPAEAAKPADTKPAEPAKPTDAKPAEPAHHHH